MEEIRTTEQEIEFQPKSMSFKDKFIWTLKIWFGFKHKVKLKVKVVE